MANERHISYLPYLPHIYIYIYTHPARVSISFEITYYSERMAVFEAGMYIVGESSNAIYRPVPWDNRQLLRFPLSPFFRAYPTPSVYRGPPPRESVFARNGGSIYRYTGFAWTGALFRSSVNNEACKHALWTPRQIASVSTKPCDTRGRADTRDRAEHRILRFEAVPPPFNSVYSTKLIRERPIH